MFKCRTKINLKKQRVLALVLSLWLHPNYPVLAVFLSTVSTHLKWLNIFGGKITFDFPKAKKRNTPVPILCNNIKLSPPPFLSCHILELRQPAFWEVFGGLCYKILFRPTHARKSYWRGRFSTVDLLLLIDIDLLLLHWSINCLFYKTSYLNEEVNCTEPFPQLVFPGVTDALSGTLAYEECFFLTTKPTWSTYLAFQLKAVFQNAKCTKNTTFSL